MEQDAKGFLSALFDFSFSTFITTRLVKILYMISIVLIGLMCLFIALSGFANGFMAGIGTLVLAPVLFLLYVIGMRIWLELVIVVFRISENMQRVADKLGVPEAPKPAAPQPPPPAAE